MTGAREIAAGFPRLRDRLETPAGSDHGAAPDGTFAYGLRMLLDGLAADLAVVRGTNG